MVYHSNDRVRTDRRARRVIEPVVSTVAVGEARLTTATWGEGTPELVLLHDGLGSIAQWRSVPASIAAAFRSHRARLRPTGARSIDSGARRCLAR